MSAQVSALPTIPIVMAMDHNFIIPSRVAIYSICKNTNDCHIDITVIHDDTVNKEDKEVLLCLEQKFSHLSLKFYRVDTACFSACKPYAHISLAGVYRLIISDVVTEDKCLYVDGDTLSCTNLQKIYSCDVHDVYLAGIRDYGWLLDPDEAIKHGNRYKIDDMRNYINSGILVFNIKKIREDGIKEKFLKETEKKYLYDDQDIINKVCVNKKILPWQYNYFHRCKASDLFFGRGTQKGIIHYTSKYKPWQYIRVRYADIWWQYAKEALESTACESLYQSAARFASATDWSAIVKKCQNEPIIVIIGYSMIGMDVANSLRCCGIHGKIYFGDNNIQKQENSIEDIDVLPVCQIAKKYSNAIFLNTSQRYNQELRQELISAGIDEARILCYLYKRGGYLDFVDEKFLEHEFCELLYKRTGRKDIKGLS